MSDQEEISSAYEDDPYERLSEKMSKIYTQESFYGSFVMLIVILALAV